MAFSSAFDIACRLMEEAIEMEARAIITVQSGMVPRDQQLDREQLAVRQLGAALEHVCDVFTLRSGRAFPEDYPTVEGDVARRYMTGILAMGNGFEPFVTNNYIGDAQMEDVPVVEYEPVRGTEPDGEPEPPCER